MFKNIWRNEKPLVGLMFLMTFIYSTFSVLKHLHFDTNAFDFGNFDQIVWHYSRFETPGCTQLGLANCLGDHFSPILALCAPLFWIWPHAEILLVVQVALIALALIPIFLYCEKRVGRGEAYLLAVSFMLFWGVQYTITSDFHPDVFEIPLIAFAIYFVDVKKWGWATVSILLLLIVKEDLTLLVSFFGLYFLLERKIKLGWGLFVTGLVFFYLEVIVWVPHFHGTEGNYPHWYFTDLGQQPSDALRAVLKDPFLPIQLLFSHWEKIRTYILLFAPFLFLPFFSRQFLLMVPLIVTKELTSNPNMWGMLNQYSASLCPILLMASAEGIARWRQKRFLKISVPFKLPSAPVGILGMNLLLLFFISSWRGVEHVRFWKFNETERTSAEVFQLIPDSASVETQTSIAPHLTHREVLYSLFDPGDCDRIKPDFFVVCQGLNCYPLSYDQVATCLNAKEKNGYQKIFDSNGWIVLERDGYPSAVSQ